MGARIDPFAAAELGRPSVGTAPTRANGAGAEALASPSTAFWVVPRGSRARHVVTAPPGTHRVNSTIKTARGAAVTLPLPTPNDRVPRTRSITKRCGECSATAQRLKLRDVVWDS